VTDFQLLLRELPAVDRLLREPAVEDALQRIPRRLVLSAVQETINLYRLEITAVKENPAALEKIDPNPENLAARAVALAVKRASSSLKPVINATGVVIHTNLGRVPLAAEAVEALTAVAGNYNNLEMSLASGKRGSRQEHLEELICELSGAEAAVVVNNNAAAVFLILKALTERREVVISRGQLVEIGGSFRIPEIMAASGTTMVEVGTTNKTYLRDYERALTENSAAFLKVHTSNYRLVGFTAEVETAELAGLAHKHNLLMFEDLGSGVLLDLKKYGLPAEPLVQDSIAAGADLVSFSGDKVLGGPQAGIIVGRKDLITAIRSNQLARILRVGKFTVAAMEATLRLYLDEHSAKERIPVWQMLTMEAEDIRLRAEKMAEKLAQCLGAAEVSVIKGISKIGGGALPAAELTTWLVAVNPVTAKHSAANLVERLRLGEPPVILRLQQDSLFFDLRTVRPDQELSLVEAINKVFDSSIL
jgi:L-seryl-tRNA(Ser) seleniumtransferase